MSQIQTTMFRDIFKSSLHCFDVELIAPIFRIPFPIMSHNETVPEELNLLGRSLLETIEIKWHRNWNKKREAMFHVAILILVFLLFGLGSLLIVDREHTNSGHEHVYHCGNSPTEANSNGCSFDVMSFTWLPAKCFDEPLIEDFLGQRNWTWYLDGHGQQKANEADVRNGIHNEVYVSWEYHLMHCTYMWRKMHWAVLQGLDSLDGYIGNPAHTEHCGEMLLGGFETASPQVTNTMIYTKFPACGKDGLHSGWYRIVDGKRSFSMPAGKHHHDMP